MTFRLLTLASIAWLAAVCPALAESGEDAATARPARAAMVARIDALVDQRLAEAGIAPAPPASDAEFLRRVHLDLAGVVPRVADVRMFLASEKTDKRAEAIDRLLVSPAHATHLANTWRQMLLPGGGDVEQAGNVAGVQSWLRERFADNLRYDNLVSDLLVATQGSEAGPALYYTSLDLAPEKLAGSTARIFLGLQIECAECHDHPFDSWKQTDFWGYAAFFAQLERGSVANPGQATRIVDRTAGEVMLPKTETIVPPAFPGGATLGEATGTRRMQLAIWMASRDNPYLARAAVNRVWARMFGRGLVEPVDDLSPRNKPSHPELFDELTDYFVATGFDLRELHATLARTAAYQRTSGWTGEQLPPAELLACMPLKTLTADQLYDSLNRVLNRQPPQAGNPLFDPQRQAFTARMQEGGRSAVSYDAGVLQALTMLNGNDAAEATDAERGSLLAGVAAPWLDDPQRVETLFLATLSRPPTDAQRDAAEKLLSEVPASDRQKALGDLLWALINSAEFTLNH